MLPLSFDCKIVYMKQQRNLTVIHTIFFSNNNETG